MDPFLGLNIAELPEGSFFGEYQSLLGINSPFDYEACAEADENTFCMTILASRFLILCDEFPEFRSTLLIRGL